MLTSDSQSIPANPVNLDSLFSGLVRKSSEGKETVDYLSAVSAFGRCVAAGPELTVLLHDACELAALVIRADLLMIAQLTPNTRQLKLRFATIDEGEEVTVETPDPISSEPDISMAAFAMHSADEVECEDIVAERRFTDLCLRRLQMGSAIFVPMCCHNRAFGALGLARKTKGRFTSDEIRFTVGISQLLASYLAQCEAEEKLRFRQAAIEATLDATESLVISLDDRGIVREMNVASVRISGFRDRELRDRPFWNTLIAPGDSERVARVFRHGGPPDGNITFDADLLSKEGQQRAVHWSLRTVEVEENSPKTYVLTGVDRTDWRECSKELEKYRRIAQGAAEAAVLSSDPCRVEKRSSPRRQYEYLQRIAPILGNSLPHDHEFEKVACHDISAGGFPFFAETPPIYDELIISLGAPPNNRKVIATVVRVVRKVVEGQSLYQVGCRFVGRVGK